MFLSINSLQFELLPPTRYTSTAFSPLPNQIPNTTNLKPRIEMTFSLGSTLNNMFNHLIGGTSIYEHPVFRYINEQKLARVAARTAARTAARAARISQAQADLMAKAKHTQLLETLVGQGQHADANARLSQNIQLLIAALLVINFIALIGVIICHTPALQDQRDRYVTPAVNSMVRGVEIVCTLFQKLNEVMIRDFQDAYANTRNGVRHVLDPVFEKCDELKGPLVEKYKDLMDRAVARIFGEGKVIAEKQQERGLGAEQARPIPATIGQENFVVFKEEDTDYDFDSDSEPEALDETDSLAAEVDAADYTPSESEDENEEEVLDGQDYIDAAEEDHSEAESEDQPEVEESVQDYIDAAEEDDAFDW